MKAYQYQHKEAKSEEAERITAHPELIFRLRNLIESSLKERVEEAKSQLRSAPLSQSKKLDEWKGDLPYDAIACSDAGSNMLPLLTPSYFCLAECLEWPSYKRFFIDPKEVRGPSDEISRYVDLLREFMRIEVMLRYLESLEGYQGNKLLILDGPLIPRLSAYPTSSDPSTYHRLFESYVKMLSYLIRTAHKQGHMLIGFVKRPEASFLHKGSLRDAEWLSLWLKYSHAYPWPPTEPSLHDRHTCSFRIRYTYLQSSSEPLRHPYRIDFSPDINDEEAERICQVLLRLSDSSGIPAPVIEVDNDVKMKREWLKTIYADACTSLQSDLPVRYWRLISLRYGE